MRLYCRSIADFIWTCIIFPIAALVYREKPRPEGWYTTQDEPWDGVNQFDEDARIRAENLGRLIDKRHEEQP